MSTKIYTAYRLKDSADLWSLLRDVQRQGRERVRAKLREAYTKHAWRVDSTTEEFQRRLQSYGHEEMVRLALARDAVRSAYREQQAQVERNDYDFDVSLSVYEHAGRLYFIPYLDYPMEGVLDFLASDARLEDYAYQNSTDCQLKHMTEEEWDTRGEVWRAIFRGSWPVSLRLDICSWESFLRVDPEMEIFQELREKYRREGVAA